MNRTLIWCLPARKKKKETAKNKNYLGKIIFFKHKSKKAFTLNCSGDCGVLTTSSILRMLRTVSVARVRALMETSSGCTTSSSRMLEIPPCYTNTHTQRKSQTNSNGGRGSSRTLTPHHFIHDYYRVRGSADTTSSTDIFFFFLSLHT